MRWPLEPEIAAGVIAGGARVIEIGVPRRRGAAKRMGGQVCDGWGGSVDSIPASGLAVAGVGIRICWASPGLLLDLVWFATKLARTFLEKRNSDV